MENKENTSTSKTVIGIVFAILTLVVAQLLALGVAELLVAVGLPIVIGNIITGVLYPIFALAGLYLLFQSLLENRFNRKVAIIAPSVLFGFLHIFGRKLDFLSILQLLVAGSIVGILFSLVTYESGTIWNSALMHGIWNMVIIGGVLQIGDTVSENAIYSYVLESKSFLITGGDFGIEASMIAIFLYLIFTILAGFRIMKNER